MTDLLAAAALIGFCVGLTIGAVVVYAAWSREAERMARRWAVACRHLRRVETENRALRESALLPETPSGALFDLTWARRHFRDADALPETWGGEGT